MTRPPSELIPNILYVGGGRSMVWLREHGITTVINLARRDYDGQRIHFTLSDSGERPERLIEAVEIIRRCITDNRVPVFLHCAAGRSRSPTVAALYLIRYHPFFRTASLATALAFVKARHRPTRPNSRTLAAAHVVLRRWRKR